MALTTSTEMGLVATPGVLRSDAYANRRDYRLRFHITVPASAGTGPTPTVCHAPKGFKPDIVYCATNGLSASGGVGLNLILGITGNTNLLMDTLDADAATSYVGLNVEASDYEFAADTDIILTMTSGKTPVEGTKVWGYVDGTVPSA